MVLQPEGPFKVDQNMPAEDDHVTRNVGGHAVMWL